MSIPTNKKLYQQIVSEAKTRFLVWPSAYASGWVVRTYLSRGGTYLPSKQDKPLARWYNQHWINVCHYLETGEKTPCGRPKASLHEYPYCRPDKRISADTPLTMDEMIQHHGRHVLEQLCSTKKKRPTTRTRSFQNPRKKGLDARR